MDAHLSPRSNCFWRYLFIGVLSCTSFSEAKVRIGDLHYAQKSDNEAAQILPIPSRIHEIIYPTIGNPSLVVLGPGEPGGPLAESQFGILLQISSAQKIFLKNYQTQLKLIGKLQSISKDFVKREVPTGLTQFYKTYEDLEYNHSQTYPPFFSISRKDFQNRPDLEISLNLGKLSFISTQGKHYLLIKAAVPENLERKYFRIYDLFVQIRRENKVVLEDRQYHSVAILSDNGSFKFAHLADPQINDFQFKIEPQKDENHIDLTTQEEILRQAVTELNFLKPDFAFITGDLVGGGNFSPFYFQQFFLFANSLFPPERRHLEKSAYWNEYASIYNFIRLLKFPVFCAPGNHDGFAAYEALNENTSHFDFLFSNTFIGKEKQKVLYDGKHFWRKMIGPLYYSFDFGDYHFVILDTYDLRRFFRVGYGSPLIPNHGGYISKKQMDWLEKDLSLATLSGKKILLFGHHDPRGGTMGMFYKEPKYRPIQRQVQPLDLELQTLYVQYSQDPLIASVDWMSPQTSVIGHEYPDGKYDPAKKLLKLIGTSNVTHYFLGHAHADYADEVQVGQRKVHFIHTTALSAPVAQTRNHPDYQPSQGEGIGPQKHWGYRIFEIKNSELREIGPLRVGNLRIQQRKNRIRLRNLNPVSLEGAIELRNNAVLTKKYVYYWKGAGDYSCFEEKFESRLFNDQQNSTWIQANLTITSNEPHPTFVELDAPDKTIQ